MVPLLWRRSDFGHKIGNLRDLMNTYIDYQDDFEGVNRMKAMVVILSILGAAMILGCLSAEKKSMNVTLTLVEWSYETEGTGEVLSLTGTAKVTATNDGDPGVVTIHVELLDELDDTFATKTEKVHLNEGETKSLTVTFEGEVSSNADLDAYYTVVAEDRTEVD